MKKITLAFLSIIIASPAFANIHINGKVATAVIKEHVPADKLNATLTAYNNVLKKSGVGSMRYGISASGLWDVCAAAGWDIKPKGGTGYNKCNAFVKALFKKGTVTYKEVCGDDKGKTGPHSKEYCVTDFKSVKVNQQPALEIAKLYACIKHKDCSVQCSSKHRTSWNDDYIKCTSQNKLAYYEFQFDSVDNSIDQTIKNGIQTAVCKIHDAPVTLGGYVGGGTNVSSQMVYVDASCAADAPKCQEINKSLSKFGYAAEYKDGKCKINFNTIRDAKDLKTAFGIDNFESCKWDMQAKNAADLEKQIKAFIAGKAGVSATSVRCDAGFKTYTGKGCKVNGFSDFKDDIKTCYAKGQQIDLVFDDINEMWKKYHDATVEGLRCVIAGGSPSGERCIGLGQQQCNMIKKAQLSDCPECKSVYWDTKTQSCVTPAGSAANSLKKGVNITLIVGGTLVGVTVTVATAGTAGAPVVAFVLTGIETVGARIELTSQLKIDGVADKFLIESNKCKSASCAETLLKQNLQRMSNFAGDMTDAESRAVDNELARLNELIPETSQFYTDIVAGESVMGANAKSLLDLDSWEPEQVWRAVGITLQLASVFTAVGKWVAGKTGMLASKLPNTTTSITNKAESIRAALKQQIASGKKVKTSNGKEVIPAGKLAATKNYAVIAEKQVQAEMDAIHGLGLSADLNRDEIADIVIEYTEKAAKATTDAQEVRAWQEYHQKMVEYLARKFDYSKTLNVARQRRRTYLEIIARDKKLAQMALDWKELAPEEKQHFLLNLVQKANKSYCNGDFCPVTVGDFLGGVTDYKNGSIEIGLASGNVNTGCGRLRHIAPNSSLDDVMTALAHEHAHSITRKNPAQSSLPKDLIGWGIIHNEDEMGNVTRNGVQSLRNNYNNLLLEKEAFLVGETVGKNFEADLFKWIEMLY